MIYRTLPWWVSLCMLPACIPQRTQVEDTTVIPAIVEAVQRHAQGVSAFVDRTQPLLVDVQSFVRAARPVFGPAVAEDEVVRALPEPHRDMTRNSAVECRTRSSSRTCGVTGGALFIQLDTVLQTAQGIEAAATYHWTDRRPSGSSQLGFSQIWLTFEMRGGRWVLRETRVGSTT